jgi:hypothetical protein
MSGGDKFADTDNEVGLFKPIPSPVQFSFVYLVYVNPLWRMVEVR